MKPKRHDSELMEAPRCPESCQLTRPGGKGNLPITFKEINGGKIFCSSKTANQVINTGNWI